MKKIFILVTLFLQVALLADNQTNESYKSPTEQLIRRESWAKIKKKLTVMKIPTHLFPLFDSIARTEKWGHIGYHGANQGFRVYQDVIRFTMEEILEIPIKENFHFLRIPGDPDLNLNSISEFYAYWGKLNNKNDKRAKQLLSLNFSIYSNFDNDGSCSLNLFVKDESKTSINYAKQLAPFYKELDIPAKALEDLFAIGQKWLDGKGGILLQIQENSHLYHPTGEAYSFSDEHCYPCKRGGHSYGSYPVSNHYERIRTELYVNNKLDIAPQLRLLLNNRYTLNPYSHLQVKRWDLYDPSIISSYEEEMRTYIRSLGFNPAKAEKYRQQLLEIWTED